MNTQMWDKEEKSDENNFSSKVHNFLRSQDRQVESQRQIGKDTQEFK
jgi:hypothetical protein